MAHPLQSILLLLVVPACLACVRSGSQSSVYSEGPEFCHGLECPKFQSVLKVKDRYEERVYESAKWVSTQVLDLDYDKAVSEGFGRLFKYIDGENDEGVKIDMTAPVTTRVIPGQGPACETNFTISFFVPFMYQQPETSPPNPTNDEVYLHDLPELRVYVKDFGGRAYEQDWLEHATDLGEELTADGHSYIESYYYTAGYDSPFRLFYRHNEIWFVASD